MMNEFRKNVLTPRLAVLTIWYPGFSRL